MTCVRGVAALCVSGLLVVAGCSDNALVAPTVTGPVSGNPGSGATYLYAINSTTVFQYSLSSSSTNLTPTATITAPSGMVFTAIATDSSGQIYVGGVNLNNAGQVVVYASGASGAATPVQTITGSAYSSTTPTSFQEPLSMHVSSAGTLAVLSSGSGGTSVVTMPATVSGAATPSTMLLGSNTQMVSAHGATIDQNGKVYVTNSGTSGGVVLEFAAGATGNTAPATTITMPTGDTPYGVAADASGDVFVALDGTTPEIAVYSAGASGSATPSRTIGGGFTGISYLGGLRLDSQGELYTINIVGGSGSSYTLLGFAQSVSGNAGPTLSIVPASLTSPRSEIAVR